MTTFTWSIAPIIVDLKAGDFENVVLEITWICKAEDGDRNTTAMGYVPLDLDPSAPFTPYQEITEAQVWAWVEEKIDRRMVEGGLAAAIKEPEHLRYAYLPTPWSQS